MKVLLPSSLFIGFGAAAAAAAQEGGTEIHQRGSLRYCMMPGPPNELGGHDDAMLVVELFPGKADEIVDLVKSVAVEGGGSSLDDLQIRFARADHACAPAMSMVCEIAAAFNCTPRCYRSRNGGCSVS